MKIDTQHRIQEDLDHRSPRKLRIGVAISDAKRRSFQTHDRGLEGEVWRDERKRGAAARLSKVRVGNISKLGN